MIRTLFSLLLVVILAGCDLFPRRNAGQNASLHQSVLAELRNLELQGLINPATPSAVVIGRYGTSFGGTVALSGTDSNGRALSAEAMTQQCLNSTNSTVPRTVKRCLRESFPSRDALEYSHGGIAYKIPGGPWRVRQSLRSVETTIHFQWFGTLEEFIDIPLVESRIQLIVPDTALQNRITQTMLVQNAGESIIDPDYNLVSKAFQTNEQMSNQFIMELIAVAMQPAGRAINRANAQLFLRENGYSSTVILLGGIQSITKWDRFFGTIDLSDQPYARRYEVGEMITMLSIRKFLSRNGRIAAVRDIRL